MECRQSDLFSPGSFHSSAPMEVEEEVICRYCFGGEEDGELISPCKCAGGQKYVHLKCLRQWQRMVLVTQPTHPAFYDRDLRHQTCNVCKSEFTCPPPTRHELMASFTGPEIAALIDTGCIIASHEAFSAELERSLEGMPPFMRHRSSYDHWIRGVFLITEVEADDGKLTIPVSSNSMLKSVRERLDADLCAMMQGRRWRLGASESLEGVERGKLAEALAELTAPCTLCLESDEDENCGNDHVVAVNLTRPLETAPSSGRAAVENAVRQVCTKYRGASEVKITHFIGGPCDEDELMCCIVLGGGGCGWTAVKSLPAAIEMAHSRAVHRSEEEGDVHGGQTVRLQGLQAAPELNGELGIALRFNPESKRWLVRLRNGEGKQLRPQNLAALEGASGRVFAVWGDARWSRAQLLGEIAKGDWGLCRANVGDLAAAPSERWTGMQGRLAFAPITEMTESYMREAQREMNAARHTMQMHSAPEEADAEAEPMLQASAAGYAAQNPPPAVVPDQE
eukprot:TRINITY_DN27260_c0_g1_i1.p1 TRINITY_DN27260_c0_g1~~TRINITY_DN27260_c0_g1_i1.p1  ORF type:complete len:509 (-),score=95.66 TRINITY_DN27260_c0_g1_i1:152-1678(-)